MSITDDQVFEGMDDIDVALGKENLYMMGVDVETTGLSCETDQIIEFAFSIWDMRTKKPVLMRSDLIRHDGLEVPPNITDITNITTKDITSWGEYPSLVYVEFLKYAQDMDFLVAHNAPFDKGFIFHHLKEFGVEETIGHIPWIDTVSDVPWKTDGSRKLGYLAYDHNFINPFSHRALFDVCTMMKLLSEYDIDEVVRRHKIPTKKVIANVSFQDKDLAKERGFKWDGENKQWWMNMKEDELKSELYPFKTTVLEL